MKNVFLLPTDKPSRLVKNDKNLLKLCIQTLPLDKEINCFPQNIYITSDEEIKDGKYGLSKLNEIIKFHSGYDYRYYAKIILTTDQDLINDGVQVIDDEFLEWYVKNPSCEEVDIVNKGRIGIFSDGTSGIVYNEYKIIIPKEDVKQEQDRNKFSEEDMLLAFQTGRNFQLTGENNFKELIEQLKK